MRLTPHDQPGEGGERGQFDKLTLRHIGIGRPHKRKRVILLIHDTIRDATTGEIIRELTIDPTRDY